MERQMPPLIVIALAAIVAIVAIDALARAAGTPKLPPPSDKGSELVSTEKIVIDLSKRK
jgi:hypothetical protein